MLIERRAYTLRPGNTEAFWQANLARGGFDEQNRPMWTRLIGWFECSTGPQPRLVHLWRYDDFEDWHTRLRLFTPNSANEAYYRAARPLMLAQENCFMHPAPIPELTPLWGNGNDWLPGDSVQGDLQRTPELLVEETVTTMLPGAMPQYWDAWKSIGGLAASQATEHLLGSFYTLVGQLHQVHHYRYYTDFAERQKHRAQLQADPNWQSLISVIRSTVVREETALLRPSPLPPMSPLFRF